MAFIRNAPTDLDMNNFISSLNQMGGIAKLARFIVTVSPVGDNNPLIQRYSTEQFRGMMYACFQAEFPGRGFQTFSTRYNGPEQIYPYNTEYSKCSLTFICRNNSVERKMFDDWQDLINPTTTFNFAYPENYYSDINIYHYSEYAEKSIVDKASSQLNYAWALRKAWPSLVKPQPVTWMDQEFLFLEVEFTYRYWDRSNWVDETPVRVVTPNI